VQVRPPSMHLRNFPGYFVRLSTMIRAPSLWKRGEWVVFSRFFIDNAQPFMKIAAR
jgi:hypothetical protein